MKRASVVEQLLTRGVEQVIDKTHLANLLNKGEPLRIKFGIDPTSPDLHLGHAVVLRKLRHFQDLGHRVILLIGDFTATIGDPSGRNQTRPPLSESEVRANMETYLEQASRIIDRQQVEIRYNSEWLGALTARQIIELSGLVTASQLLEREDFRSRLSSGQPLGMHEILYPLFQGYDSVVLEADVELGGSDQILNLLMGRTLMGRMGFEPQDAMTVSLLEGTDGKKKMSKSGGNYIGLAESPNEIFGKVMAIPDELTKKYFSLLSDDTDENIEKHLARGPRDAKLALAYGIVCSLHGEDAAGAAREEFLGVFASGKLPKNIPEVVISESEMGLLELVVRVGFASSKSEARRLVEQGGVRVSEEQKTDPSEKLQISDGLLVQVGPRRFVRVRRNVS